MAELIFFCYYYDLGRTEANAFGFLSEIENRNRSQKKNPFFFSDLTFLFTVDVLKCRQILKQSFLTMKNQDAFF